ncbi:MAG: hypothetical protein LBQ66_00455 [Planctomycetaceae bacterium]|jgi:hypothetical protein|nr:hypothetical protein [Planctomycetaceae bacterium]
MEGDTTTNFFSDYDFSNLADSANFLGYLDCGLDAELIKEAITGEQTDHQVVIEPTAKQIKRELKTQLRRTDKQKNLTEVYQVLPAKGESIHILGVNLFDIWSVILQTIEYLGGEVETLLLSSWVCNREIANTIIEMMQKRTVKNFAFFTSTMNRSRDTAVYEQIINSIIQNGGKFCVINSHAKIYLVQQNDNYIVIESSGNLSDNSNMEQTVINNDKELFEFYYSIYKGILAQKERKKLGHGGQQDIRSCCGADDQNPVN